MFTSVQPSDVTLKNYKNARFLFTMGSGMVAYQLFNTKVGFTRDIPTGAATFVNDKPFIWLNPDYFDTLANGKQRAGLLYHEVSHLYLDHIGRANENNYNAKLWNIATDLYINYMIKGMYKGDKGEVKQSQKYKDHFDIGEGWLYEEQYIGMSADQIYRKLVDDAGGSPENALEQFGDEFGANGDDCEGEGGQQPGKGSSGKGSPLDSVDGDSPSNQAKVHINKTNAGAVASATSAKNIGDNEGDLVEYFYDLMQAKVDWRDKFSNLISNASKERYTYNRPSRRSQGDIFFPSMYGTHVNLLFLVDSSGSMFTELKEAMSEMNGILNQFDSWKIKLVTCDAQAHVIGEYSSEENTDMSDISPGIAGGGGTELSPLLDYATEQYDMGDDITAAIIFTDGYLDAGRLAAKLNPMIETFVCLTSGGDQNFKLGDCEVVKLAEKG